MEGRRGRTDREGKGWKVANDAQEGMVEKDRRGSEKGRMGPEGDSFDEIKTREGRREREGRDRRFVREESAKVLEEERAHRRGKEVETIEVIGDKLSEEKERNKGKGNSG